MKKKILMFLQAGVGGAERVTITIGKNLDREKYDVSFCLVGNENDDVSVKSFIPEDYVVSFLPNADGFKLFLRLKKILSDQKPDFVFSSSTRLNTKLLGCALFYKKIKFIVRNNNYLYTLSRKQKFILKLTYRFADYVVAQTEEMAKELKLLLNDNFGKVVTLHNPIDKNAIDDGKNAFLPYKNNAHPVYVASGRFHPVKGFDVLIKAFKIVLQKQNRSELHILGKTSDNCEDYYRKVVEIAKECGVSDRVVFEGFQKNPYPFVKTADCFVLSSRNEGLPNVLIESLYLGTPVAATTCIPIIARIVNQGENGFLADVDSPESLADAMLNASMLGRVVSAYQSASEDDFQRLFEL